MSNNESLIKELKTLLEDARSSVLKELNHKSNFIQRIFAASTESLSQAQSNLSKAINVTDKLNGVDSGTIAKLQTHLNEKSKQIQELEAKIQAENAELGLLQEKSKSQENEIKKLKTSLIEAEKTATVKAAPSVDNSKLENEITELKLQNQDLKERLKASRDQESEAWDLSVEFSQRLKKLKAELVSH